MTKRKGGARTRLTSRQIQAINDAYAKGATRPAIAKRFGIAKSTCDKHLRARRPDELAAARKEIALLREENEVLRAIVESCS